MLVGVDAHNLEGNRTGVGRYLFNLLKEWQAAPDVQFILYFKDRIPAELSEYKSINYKLLKTDSTAKFIHWNLPRAAKKDKVDILFCPGYVAPIFYSGKIALTLHDIIYESHPEWFNWPSLADRILLRWVSKKSAKKASVIFTPSEFSRQEVIKYYRVPPAKVTAIPLATDLDFFQKVYDPAGDKLLKEKFNVKNKFILYIGSIFTRRHLAEIIEAFGRLARDDKDWQLFIVGVDYTPGKTVSNLLIQKNKELTRNAIIKVDAVAQNELKLLYSSCAFFIWLSDYEGFGLPVIEAMCLGAPVISSGGTSLSEVAGQATFLIKNNSDAQEIYQAMKQLASDEKLRSQLTKKGMEQATKFSWEKCAEETLKILRKYL